MGRLGLCIGVMLELVFGGILAGRYCLGVEDIRGVVEGAGDMLGLREG